MFGIITLNTATTHTRTDRHVFAISDKTWIEIYLTHDVGKERVSIIKCFTQRFPAFRNLLSQFSLLGEHSHKIVLRTAAIIKTIIFGP